MNTQHRTPSYTNHNGFRMPIGFPPEGFTSGINYQAQAGEVFISTYPKCGTTWTQNIIWMLRHHGTPLPVGTTISEVIPHLEEFGSDSFSDLAIPRIIKTHLPFSMTPYHPETNYVYVARNPFDCVVSFFYHTKGFTRIYDFAKGTFDDYFECFIKGEVDFGDYFDNLLSWYQHKDDHNVLFMTYEAMQVNTRAAILEMAEFLGGPFYQNAQNPEILNNILHHSSFESMSKDQCRWSTARPKDYPFIRKGKVGDWKDHFSENQTRRLLEKFHNKTQGTAIYKLWPEILPL